MSDCYMYLTFLILLSDQRTSHYVWIIIYVHTYVHMVQIVRKFVRSKFNSGRTKLTDKFTKHTYIITSYFSYYIFQCGMCLSPPVSGSQGAAVEYHGISERQERQNLHAGLTVQTSVSIIIHVQYRSDARYNVRVRLHEETNTLVHWGKYMFIHG